MNQRLIYTAPAVAREPNDRLIDDVNEGDLYRIYKHRLRYRSRRRARRASAWRPGPTHHERAAAQQYLRPAERRRRLAAPAPAPSPAPAPTPARPRPRPAQICNLTIALSCCGRRNFEISFHIRHVDRKQCVELLEYRIFHFLPIFFLTFNYLTQSTRVSASWARSFLLGLRIGRRSYRA